MHGRAFSLRRVVAAGGIAMLLAGPASALQVGERAPDFTLPGTGAKQVRLADLLGKGPVVIYTFVQAFAGL